MQYVTSTAFLLAYANSLASTGGASVSCGGSAADVPASALVAVAKKQVDYILGANPTGMSYMVGFGALFPRRVPAVRARPPRAHRLRAGVRVPPLAGPRSELARRCGRRRARRRRSSVHRQPRQLRTGRARYLHSRSSRRPDGAIEHY
jgi:hypothetical protein